MFEELLLTAGLMSVRCSFATFHHNTIIRFVWSLKIMMGHCSTSQARHLKFHRAEILEVCGQACGKNWTFQGTRDGEYHLEHLCFGRKCVAAMKRPLFLIFISPERSSSVEWCWWAQTRQANVEWFHTLTIEVPKTLSPINQRHYTSRATGKWFWRCFNFLCSPS